MPQVITAAAPSMRGTREVQSGRWLALGWFASPVVEYKRAIAAEQRYRALNRASPPTVVSSGIADVAVPCCILEEFYSSTANARRGKGACSQVPDASRRRLRGQQESARCSAPSSASGTYSGSGF